MGNNMNTGFTENKLIRTIDALLIVAIFFFTCAFLEGIHSMQQHQANKHYEQAASQLEATKPYSSFQVDGIPLERIKHMPQPAIQAWANMQNILGSIDISYTTIELDYLGMYFITAYCPSECGGSWTTSSGVTCHYSAENYTPTTCAIDRNFHSYGDLLMIDGKIYVAEDTGPGVQGRWVDCFVETMFEVETFNTRYTDVYAVSYATHTISSRELMCQNEWSNYYRLCNVLGTRHPFGECGRSPFK